MLISILHHTGRVQLSMTAQLHSWLKGELMPLQLPMFRLHVSSQRWDASRDGGAQLTSASSASAASPPFFPFFFLALLACAGAGGN